ncbi:MAG: oligosaccharide flippase family protein [Pelobacteraceae bacterium]
MRKTFFNIASSNMAGAGLGFLFNIVLARMLDIASYGRASFIFALVFVMGSIADFGFSNGVVIFHNRYSASISSPIAVVNYLFYRLLLIFAAISIPVLVLFRHFYALTGPEAGLLYVSSISLALYRYISAVHQALGDWRRFNRLQVVANGLKFGLGSGCVLALSYWWPVMLPYSAALTGYLAATLAALAVSVAATGNTLAQQCPVEQVRRDVIRLLVPLGVSSIMVVITMRFDYLVIQKFLGDELLGIYSAANTLAFVFPLLTISLMNILLRETALRGDEVLSQILAAQLRYLPHMLLVFAVVWVLAGQIIPLLFGNRYILAVPYFRLLLIPYMGGIFFTPLESYYYARDPMTILWFKAGQMAIVVVCSLLLIGAFRLYGVVLAIVLSRILGWLVLYVRSRLIIASRQTSL